MARMFGWYASSERKEKKRPRRNYTVIRETGIPPFILWVTVSRYLIVGSVVVRCDSRSDIGPSRSRPSLIRVSSQPILPPRYAQDLCHLTLLDPLS